MFQKLLKILQKFEKKKKMEKNKTNLCNEFRSQRIPACIGNEPLFVGVDKTRSDHIAIDRNDSFFLKTKKIKIQSGIKKNECKKNEKRKKKKNKKNETSAFLKFKFN